MTRASYKGKHIIGTSGSEGKSMTVMAGSLAAGRLGAGEEAGSSHLIHKSTAERKETGLVWAFLNLKAFPSDVPPLTRPYLVILPKTRDQAFKYMSLQGLFASKPPQNARVNQSCWQGWCRENGCNCYRSEFP